MSPVIVAPSVLSADWARLGEEAGAMAAAGADWLHVDVMDGHFVPNLSFGPAAVAALRRSTTLPLDVHLMIAPADPMLEAFAAAGATRLTVHAEAGPHLHRTLSRVAALGVRAGVAINPGTPVAAVEPVLGLVDLVLVMTVDPGFGGQAFLRGQLPRIAAVRTMIERLGAQAHVEADGGVDMNTAGDAVAAGADVLVAGTAAFRGGPGAYAANLAALRSALP